MVTPFTSDEYADRVARVARAAAGAGLDGLVITPGPDLAYLCGYTPPVTERLTLLAIAADRDPVLVVPRLERGDAEKCPGASHLRLVDWPDGTDPYAVAAEHLGAAAYAISDSAWAMHVLGLQRTAPHIAYKSMTEVLPMLRAVKDDAELARLRGAGEAADRAFEAILTMAFAGRRELDVAADLTRLLHDFGHERVDFALVCSGPNGANPHHHAGERVIEDGDMVVLDFGGLRDGYGSDISRTVHVGEPTEEELTVHDVVRRAQQAAFDAVAPGVPCEEIDRVARRIITEAGYGEQFVHRTGHGIGMSGHEPPYLVEGEGRPLVPGMCFSIEPGIYLKGRFGVRIEDIVTVTETGGERFNLTTRDLAVVG
ncbi:MAG: aminopeptidase P family protein [Hamadaea sp.]|nr:aminopeptidase P family protein [Hamadaea sp.]